MTGIECTELANALPRWSKATYPKQVFQYSLWSGPASRHVHPWGPVYVKVDQYNRGAPANPGEEWRRLVVQNDIQQ